MSIYPDGKEPLSWTQKMNNIKNRAEEIVFSAFPNSMQWDLIPNPIKNFLIEGDFRYE